MKKSLLAFTTVIISTAIATSIYLATLEEPTDIQNKLSTTTNAIAISGTAAIFGLLDNDSDENSKKTNQQKGDKADAD